MAKGISLTKQLDLDSYESEADGLAEVCGRIEAHLTVFFPSDEYETTGFAEVAGRLFLQVFQRAFQGTIAIEFDEDMVLDDGRWVPKKTATLKATRCHLEVAGALRKRGDLNGEECPILFHSLKNRLVLSGLIRLLWNIIMTVRHLFVGHRAKKAFEKAANDSDYLQADGRWQAFLAGLEEKLDANTDCSHKTECEQARVSVD